MEQENYIDYHITENQAKLICKHFYKNLEDVEEYEVCEMLDKIIDNL